MENKISNKSGFVFLVIYTLIKIIKLLPRLDKIIGIGHTSLVFGCQLMFMKYWILIGKREIDIDWIILWSKWIMTGPP